MNNKSKLNVQSTWVERDPINNTTKIMLGDVTLAKIVDDPSTGQVCIHMLDNVTTYENEEAAREELFKQLRGSPEPETPPPQYTKKAW